MPATHDQRGEGLSPETERLRRYYIPIYRLTLVREATISTSWPKQVRQAKDVADFMAPLAAGLEREHFWVLFLNGKNKVIGLNLVAVGSLSTALVHPRELLKGLILANAAATILVHNHPSGDPEPSAEDRAITRRLVAVGDLVGIRVLDHIVLGEAGAFHSLADDGTLDREVAAP